MNDESDWLECIKALERVKKVKDDEYRKLTAPGTEKKPGWARKMKQWFYDRAKPVPYWKTCEERRRARDATLRRHGVYRRE